MTKNLDRAELKIAIKEILTEEVRTNESSEISEEEARLFAKRQFKKYTNVFKALA